MKPTRRNRTVARFLALLVVCGAAASAFVPPARAADHVTFVGVAPDQEYRDADARLIAFLQKASGYSIDRRLPVSYGDAIALVLDLNKRKVDYLARLTPYACVAAEMLGADFDVLGTYQSKATNTKTYHSYFVVNRETFRKTMHPNSTEAVVPRLEEIPEYLRRLQSSSPPKFVYHDKFSTSSYFLPSLHFRLHRVFAMDQPVESLIAIDAKKLDVKSSSVLVEEVAKNNAALSAVWDGTKSKYEDTPDLRAAFGNLVYFIQLPNLLPNDLLVASASLGKAKIQALHTALQSARKPTPSAPQGERIDVGDFAWWEDINDAHEANVALADLRREAAASPAPVPIRVEEATDPKLEELVQAARQAIRLAGTEFVLFDPDFHKTADIVWKLTPIHDGAVLLKSSIDLPPDIAPQEFAISFTSPEDLTVRIGALIHNRLNRIRYVWPYQDRVPTVIRDVDFALPRASGLRVARITWVDPAKNEFNEGANFNTEVADSDFYKFQLRPNPAFEFDPMSNAAYRVVLVRPAIATWWLKMFTYAFVTLLLLAAAWAVWELSRRPRKPAVLTPAADKPSP
jgi:ABC-type phosphate/phosphonate transport system substrate-binding protein